MLAQKGESPNHYHIGSDWQCSVGLIKSDFTAKDLTFNKSRSSVKYYLPSSLGQVVGVADDEELKLHLIH